MSIDKQKQRLAELRKKKEDIQKAVENGVSTKTPENVKRDINAEMKRVHRENGDDATDDDDDANDSNKENDANNKNKNNNIQKTNKQKTKKKKRPIEITEEEAEGGKADADDDDNGKPAKKKQKKTKDGDRSDDDARDNNGATDEEAVDSDNDERKTKKKKQKENNKNKSKKKEKEKPKEDNTKKKKKEQTAKEEGEEGEGEGDSSSIKKQQQQPPQPPPKKEKTVKKKTPEEEFDDIKRKLVEYRKQKRQEQWMWIKNHSNTAIAHYSVQRIVFVAAIIRCPSGNNNNNKELYVLQPDTITADGGTSQCWFELQNFLLAIGHSSLDAMRAEKRLCEMNSEPRVVPGYKRVLHEDGKTICEMRCISLEQAALWTLQDACLPSAQKKEGLSKDKIRKQVSSLLGLCMRLGFLLSKHRSSSLAKFDDAASKFLESNEDQITVMKSLFINQSSELIRLYSVDQQTTKYTSIDDDKDPLSVICPELAYCTDTDTPADEKKKKKKVLPLWWRASPAVVEDQKADEPPAATAETEEAAKPNETETETDQQHVPASNESNAVTEEAAPAMEEVVETPSIADATTTTTPTVDNDTSSLI